jgi:WD40 repeat protein
MAWPLPQDYNEAIQNPRTTFGDPELREGEAVTNALGLPLPRSGNFADVYEVSCPATQSRWAVKCFTRAVSGLRERYREISNYLLQVQLPFFVEFTYLEEGIRVHGQWYPILKMQWVEGLLLNEFVRDALDRPATLEALAQVWVRMARRLREGQLAHGDFQHGNVLLVPGSKTSSLAVKLVDYDGLFVPTLAQGKSGEVGHAAYQHPQRVLKGNYNLEVDRFPLLVIATSLRGLQVAGRRLWEKYDNGDNLLFREADLRAPAESALVKELWHLDDAETHALVGHLVLSSRRPLERTPLLDELLNEGRTPVLDPMEERQVADLIGARRRTSAMAVAQAPIERETMPALAERPEREAAIAALAPADWEALADTAPSRPPRRRLRIRRRPKQSFGALTLAGFVVAGLVIGLILWASSQRSGPTESKTALDQTQLDTGPRKEASPELPTPSPEKKVESPVRPREQPAKQSPRLFPVRTPLVRLGGQGSGSYTDTATPNLLIGFYFTTADHGQGSFIKSLQPIYLMPAGKHAATVYGQPNGPVTRVEARDGYAVGGVLASQGPDDLKLVFMRVKGQALDVKDSYESPWICGRGRVASIVLGCDGRPVVGIHGQRDATDVVALGLFTKNNGERPSEKVGEVRRFEGHQGIIYRIAFSPDGHHLLTSSDDRTVRLWDVSTGRELGVFQGHSQMVLNAVFSPDGKLALSSSGDGTLRLWDLHTGGEQKQFVGHSNWIEGIGFRADGKQIYSASRDDTCRAWDVETAQEIGRFGSGKLTLYHLAVSAQGDRALFSAGDNSVCVWDLAAGKELGRLPGHTAHVYALAFSNDGKYGASAGADGTIRIWDLQSLTEKSRLIGNAGPVFGVAFTPDGRRLVSGSQEGVVRLWDLETGAERHRFLGHNGEVRGVAVSPDGRYAASAGTDRITRLWRLPRDGEEESDGIGEVRQFAPHGNTVLRLAVSRDGRWLLTACWDKTIRLFDIATGRLVREFERQSQDVHAVAFSPDAQFAFSGGPDKLISVWDTQTGKKLKTRAGHAGDVYHLAIFPDGRHLVSCGPEKTLFLWDVTTGRVAARWDAQAGVGAVAVSPNGDLVLSAGQDGILRLWNVATGQVQQLHGHTASIHFVAFSPDGALAASCSDDETIRLWDVVRRQQLRVIAGHNQTVWSVAFSPGGRQILSAGADATVRLWDVATGRPVARFEGHTRWVPQAVFTPNGRYAISGSEDRTVRLWRLPSAEQIAALIEKPGEVRRFVGHTQRVRRLALSPDGRQLVTACWDGIVRLFDVESALKLRDFERDTRGVFETVAFAPDGRTAFSAGFDQVIRQWDVETGKVKRRFESNGEYIYHLAVSPDGRRVAACGPHRAWSLWDAPGGRLMYRRESPVTCNGLAISPDGSRLLNGGDDGVVRLWDLVTGEEIRRFHEMAGGSSPRARTRRFASGTPPRARSYTSSQLTRRCLMRLSPLTASTRSRQARTE